MTARRDDALRGGDEMRGEESKTIPTSNSWTPVHSVEVVAAPYCFADH